MSAGELALLLLASQEEEGRGEIPMLKSWIEELHVKNRALETEVGNLKKQNQGLRTENQKLKVQLAAKSDVKLMGPLMRTTLKRQKTQIEEAERKRLIALAIAKAKANQPPRPNPFMIEEIVGVLLGFVNVGTLKKCRLVNRIWRKVTKKHFEARAVVEVNSANFDNIPAVMNVAANAFPKFRNLRLELSVMNRLEWTENVRHVSALFIEHGKNLRFLSLDFGYINSDNWGGMDDFRDLFLASLEEIVELELLNLPCYLLQQPRMFNPNNLRKILPKLEILDIRPNCRLWCRSGSTSARTEVLSDLISIAPNLHTLHWWPQSSGTCYNLNSTHMIETLVEVNPQNLRTLFIYTEIPASAVERLATSTLMLYQLKLAEYQLFDLHLRTFGQCTISPKRVQYGRISAADLARHLKQELAKLGKVSCVKLLQTFKSALTAKLNEG